MQYKNKVAMVYLMAFFINLVNMFIATIAFPSIGRELHASFEQLSWIANIYSLALALVIPASAWLSDRHGEKKIFILALLGSLIAIVLCGIATSIDQLILWRFLQGVFGGLLIPVGQTMVYKQFAPSERAKLSMIILAVASIAPAISPAIGGVIVDMLNWRFVFFINIPIILIIIGLSWVWLVEEYTVIQTKFDLFGMILISLALALIIYGLSSFKTVADIWSSLSYFGVGVILLLSFVFYSRKAKNALLDLKVVKNKLFAVGMIFYLCISGVFTGISVLNIFLFQSAFGMSAAQTGLLMLPFSFGAFLGIIVAGKLFNKVGPKPITLTVLVIWIIGLLLLLVISSRDQYKLALGAYFLLGIGSGTGAYVAQTISMLSTKNEDLSKASAIWNLNRQLSFSVGVAIFAMIFQLLLSAYGIHNMTNFSYSANLLKVFHSCFIIAALIAIIPILATFCFRNKMVLDLLVTKIEK